MTAPLIKTAGWFTKLPDDHVRIGISRGVPRRQAAGYRLYTQLTPGSWFNLVSVAEYDARYKAEILAPLNARTVAAELAEIANGRVATLLCFERPGGTDWCHRAMCAAWLAEALGQVVPEFGYEHLPQHEHPLMPAELRRPITATEIADVIPYIGKTAIIEGGEHVVVGTDPNEPGRAIVSVAGHRFSTGIETLRRYFS